MSVRLCQKAKSTGARAALAGSVFALLALTTSPALASEAPDMAVGPVTAAPRGFLDLCARDLDSCRVGDEDLQTLQAQRIEANRRYMAQLFGRPFTPASPSAAGNRVEAAKADASTVVASAAGPVVPEILLAPVTVPALFGLPYETLRKLGVTPFAGWMSAAAGQEPDILASDLTSEASAAAADASSDPGVVSDFRPDAALSVEDVMQAQAASRTADVNDGGGLPEVGTPEVGTSGVGALPGPETQTATLPLYTLDEDGWRLVNSINRRINRAVRHVSDDRLYGVADYWARAAEGGRGDCEDYVLAKRAALIEAGVPAQALSIAIVQTRWGESHAVLLLASDEGEFVLDSLSPWIARWDRVDYRWRERQRRGHPFDWVMAAV